MTSNKTKTVKEKAPAKKTVRKVKQKVTKENLEPVVVKGTHLTVTTWPNGRTELKWDDDALLKEVRNAILKYESSVTASTTKSSARKSRK